MATISPTLTIKSLIDVIRCTSTTKTPPSCLRLDKDRTQRRPLRSTVTIITATVEEPHIKDTKMGLEVAVMIIPVSFGLVRISMPESACFRSPMNYARRNWTKIRILMPCIVALLVSFAFCNKGVWFVPMLVIHALSCALYHVMVMNGKSSNWAEITNQMKRTRQRASFARTDA